MENYPNFSDQELEQDAENVKNRVSSAVENRIEAFRQPNVAPAEIGLLMADLQSE